MESDKPVLEIKAGLDDFVVEEQLGWMPTGEGEHLYLWIEKRDLSTARVAAALARWFGIAPRSVGFAGRKDRFACTRQWFSLAGVESARAAEFRLAGAQILEVTRHGRKLRLGAHLANRFELLVGGAAGEDRKNLELAFRAICDEGLSNRFGPQRFGADGVADRAGELALGRDWRGFLAAIAASSHWPASNALEELRQVLEREGSAGHRGLARLAPDLPGELAPLARQLARRRGDFEGAARALDQRLVTFAVSALQARLFNRLLAARAQHSLELEVGDLCTLRGERGLRAVAAGDDLEAWRLAARRAEAHPSGPMFGWRAPLAGGRPGDLEREILAAAGLELAEFQDLLPGISPRGSRRPLRVAVGAGRLEWRGSLVYLAFELPPGVYATTLVSQLQESVFSP
ncbi:MAG: tRNA pseudouridine(13) synthase TruD [bacterium]